jgi:putative transposase
MVVQPETVVRWHHRRFRSYWRSISTPGPGRPPILEETRALIVRMATEKGWRARKIQAELSRLGVHLGLTTISRYLPKADPDKSPQQRWMTFLRNHRNLIAGMDCFVVPTVRLQLLSVGDEL